MTQTTNRLFDEIAKLMTDAAGVAQGVRREAETAIKSQLERLLADMDLVRRDELDALREMASRAREENERLAERISALDERLRRLERGPADVSPPGEIMVADGGGL